MICQRFRETSAQIQRLVRARYLYGSESSWYLTMLSLLVAINLAFAAVVQPYEITTNSASDIVNKTFSYVIVGGGTAGEWYSMIRC